jgi:hypothetical protein
VTDDNPTDNSRNLATNGKGAYCRWSIKPGVLVLEGARQMPRSRFRPAWLCGTTLAFATCAGLIQAQTTDPKTPRPLVLNQTHYRLRAGERIAIDAPAETVDFVRKAKDRVVRSPAAQGNGLAFGVNRLGDQAVLAASLRTRPGAYNITISATRESGEVRAAAINVTVIPCSSFLRVIQDPQSCC